MWRDLRAISDGKSGSAFEVKDLLKGSKEVVHADRLTLYRAQMYNTIIDSALLRYAQNSETSYQDTKELTGIRQGNMGIEISVQKEGLPDKVNFIWEPLSQVAEDLPGCLHLYLRTAWDPALKKKSLLLCSFEYLRLYDLMGAVTPVRLSSSTVCSVTPKFVPCLFLGLHAYNFPYISFLENHNLWNHPGWQPKDARTRRVTIQRRWTAIGAYGSIDPPNRQFTFDPRLWTTLYPVDDRLQNTYSPFTTRERWGYSGRSLTVEHLRAQSFPTPTQTNTMHTHISLSLYPSLSIWSYLRHCHKTHFLTARPSLVRVTICHRIHQFLHPINLWLVFFESKFFSCASPSSSHYCTSYYMRSVLHLRKHSTRPFESILDWWIWFLCVRWKIPDSMAWCNPLCAKGLVPLV